jgi:ATP-dependent protease HslVU (ClpYQ) peptidase subunit
MTTIAAKSGIMASDRRVTAGEFADVSYPKIRKAHGYVVGAAGNYAKAARFLRWFERGMKGRVPATGGLQILAGRNGALEFWSAVNGELVRMPVEGYAAIGSGEDVAKGAMFAGAGAVTAVKAAIAHDTGTGNGWHFLRYG